MTETGSHTARVGSVIAGVALFMNGAFWSLSQLYFDDHRLVGDVIDATGRHDARVGFFVLTVLTSLATFAVSSYPRVLGHALAVLLGLVSILGGFTAISHGLPPVVAVVLLTSGVLMPLLAWMSWHRSRAGWAFLIAVVAVCGGVNFFGAPKIRGLLDIGLWTALDLPALQVVTVAALAMLRRQYRDA